MKFHSLYIRIKGKASHVENGGPELDIADEFSRLARSLGLESGRDSCGGLWATQYVYDDHSSLRGDFLARELHVDLLCNGARSVPFGAIFLCLGETLRRIAQCDITEVDILIKSYSVGGRIRKRTVRANLQYFSDLKAEVNPLPMARCSTIRSIYKDKQDSTVPSRVLPLSTSPCSLPELALPIYGMWSQWEESLRHAKTIRITID